MHSRSFQRIYGTQRLREWKKQHSCPVTKRLCEEEMVWLPRNILLGGRADIDDIGNAIEKVYKHRRFVAKR